MKPHKQAIAILTSILISFNISAQQENIAAELSLNVGVIPTPQKVALNGSGEWTAKYNDNGTVKIRKKIATKKIEGVACNDGQSYKIEVGKHGVTVWAVSDTGFRYAALTLKQMDHHFKGSIPYMTIIDYPAYQYRGWLDDISRGPIANDFFILAECKTMEDLKMNFFNLYTEHTLYNRAYPDVSPMATIFGPYSLLPTFRRHTQIEWMGNLQCFAHFEETLKIPFYRDLMDSRDVINPANEASYKYLYEQIDSAVKHYNTSRFFNISCDETEGLGSGRAAEYVNRHGADAVYCQHINKIYKKLKSHNKEVLMWGDIVSKKPEMLEHLPKDMNYIVWTYVAQENYRHMLEPYKKAKEQYGTPFWVAPGVSHWSSIPQVRNYMENIAHLSRDGHQAGAKGLMNTAWDDSGESLFGDCWHAMAWSAEMAWNPIKSNDPAQAKEELKKREKQFNANYNSLMFEGKGDVTKAIYAVGNLAHNPYVGDWFNTGTLTEPLLNFYPTLVDDKMLIRCDSVEQLINQILALPEIKEVPHFEYACHRILLTAEKSRLRVLLSRHQTSDVKKMQEMSNRYFKHLHELKKEYLTLWDAECTESFRDEICARYDRLANEVLEADRHVFIHVNDASQPQVSLNTLYGNTIYYTLDGRKPDRGSNLYTDPFQIDHSCILKTVCYNEWNEAVYTEQYLLCHKGMAHLNKLNTPYSTYHATYSGGGDNALADGVLGSETSYNDGHWQGYWGENIDVEYDFGEAKNINKITTRFLQNTFNWILAPTTIHLYTSTENNEWKLVKTAQFTPDFRRGEVHVHTNTITDLNITTQRLRIVVENPGKLPSWHPAPNQPSYLFIDEIVIE